MIRLVKQLGPLLGMNVQTLPKRLGTTSVIVVGIASVVAVLVSVLAMAVGFRHTLADSGRPDRVIVLRGGSEAEVNSSLSRNDFDTISSQPGILTAEDGKPAVSPEIVNVVNLPKIDTGSDANVTLRGVGQRAGSARPELKIVEGRMFRPAVRELIAGVGAAKQFKGLTVGNVLHFRNADWTVVGLFTSGGDVHESELIADVDTVGSALGYASSYNSVIALLDSPDRFQSFKDALTTDPRLRIDVQREPEYYAAQAKELTKFIDIFGGIVGIIMAVGAVFGALNSMYSAVRTRTLEIATLRAIGFAAGPVLLSVMVEALLLSLAGGIIGASLAWLFFNGHSVSTLGGAFAQVVFQLHVSATLILTGVMAASAIGLIGGFFPALRAARAPIVEALRRS